MEVKLNESPVVIPPPTVTITLSYKEACALMALTGKMSGNADLNTKFVEPLYLKLEKILGGIYFGDPTEAPMQARQGLW